MSTALKDMTATSSQDLYCLLHERLAGRVFHDGDEAYEESIASYAYQQTRLRPSCVVKPTTAKEVATAVEVLRKNDVRFAVRGGGHNINAGKFDENEKNFQWCLETASSLTIGGPGIQEGVTIDMRAVNTVEIKKENMLVRVGAGALWQTVYDTLEPHGLSVLGGRIGDVGVAGLTLGGGISFFSAARGWVCDSLANIEIVLASGSIVNADATSNADLFAALKGGGNNFGIVTRFDFKIFPQGPMWCGRITYHSNPSVDKKLLHAFHRYKSEEFDKDTGMWLCFARLRTLDLRLSYTSLFHADPEAQPGNLKRFVEIEEQIANDLKTQYAGEVARELAEVSDTPDAFTIWSTNTFTTSPEMLQTVYDTWEKLADSVGDAVDTMAYIQSIPPSPSSSSPNSLGMPSSTRPERDFVLFQAILSYKDCELTSALEERMNVFVQDVDNAAKSEGMFVNWKYGNYAAWWQDVLGDEVKEGLRSVSKKYDAEGVFQGRVAGGWKVC